MSTIFNQLVARNLANLSTESVEVEKVAGEGPKGADLVGAKNTDLPKTKDNADEGNNKVIDLVDAKNTDLPKTANNADEGNDEVHDLVEGMMSESKKMEEKQKEFEEGGRVHASMESLLMGTLNTYGANGMSEQALALYSISVESALRVAGLDNLPLSVIVPSFEAADTQLAVVDKVEKKGQGILKTIISWVVKAFKYIGQALTKFAALFKANKKKVADRAGRLIAMVKGQKPTEAATAAKDDTKAIGQDKTSDSKEVALVSEIKVSDTEAKIMSRDGTITTMEEAAKSAAENYNKAMRAWGTSFDVLINMPAVSVNTDAGENLKKLTTSIASKAGKGFKEDLNVNEELVVTPGKDSTYPMIGADVKVIPMHEAKAADIKVPSKDALVKLLETIQEELNSQSQAEQGLNGAIAHVNKSAAEYEKISGEVKNSEGLDVTKATSNLMSATSIFSRGIALAGTSYVTTLNTILNVVQRSVDHAA
jgi:hypothetical protein